MKKIIFLLSVLLFFGFNGVVLAAIKFVPDRGAGSLYDLCVHHKLPPRMEALGVGLIYCVKGKYCVASASVEGYRCASSQTYTDEDGAVHEGFDVGYGIYATIPICDWYKKGADVVRRCGQAYYVATSPATSTAGY